MSRCGLLLVGYVCLLAAGGCEESAPAASEPPLVREVTLADDASKLVNEPGAYEWWNFFALDAASDLSVSMIFNAADPFNCDYRRAVYAHRADPDAPAPSPRDYSLLQLQVTVDGTTVFSALRNPPGVTVSFSEEEPRGQVGDSTFSGSVEGGVKVYRLHIDAPDTTNNARMEADIVLSAGAPGFTVNGGLYGTMEGGTQHAWQFPLGNPRSSGHVRVTRRDGEVLVDKDLEGGGYTDHMWGGAMLTDSLSSWHFGTAELGGEGTLIYVWLEPRAGHGASGGYAFLETPGKLAEAFVLSNLVGSDRREGQYGLAYDARIELEVQGGDALRAQLDPASLSADWPFQVAGPSRLDVSLPGREERMGVEATSEYLWQPGIDTELYYRMFDLVQTAAWGEDWY